MATAFFAALLQDASRSRVGQNFGFLTTACYGLRYCHGSQKYPPFYPPLTATAAATSFWKADLSILSPSKKSIARRVPAARLALNRPPGSATAAPLANVSLTLSLYVSPVQIMPLCDQAITPSGLDGFCHLTSSTISGPVVMIRSRSCESFALRQSPACLRIAAIGSAGGWAVVVLGTLAQLDGSG